LDLTEKCVEIPAHGDQVSGRRRSKDIKIIVGHMTATPIGSSEGVSRYFASPDPQGRIGSTQLVIDYDRCVRCVQDYQICQGARSSNDYANRQGLHFELCCTPGDNFHTRKCSRMLHRAAYKTAQWCKRYEIPARYLTDAELRAGKRGITDHAQITRAFRVAHGHTDFIPRRRAFLRWVRRYIREVK
jgi:hypothetical protein